MTTTILRAGIRGDGYAVLRKAVRQCLPFKTSGALRGEKWERSSVSKWDLGELSPWESNRFLIDHLTGIDYVVFSYQTPIAWVRKDKVVYRVSQRFSRTTSRHQGAIYDLGSEIF